MRQSAGLGIKDPVAGERGLANTLFAVCVVREATVVGYIDAHALPTSIICLMANKGVAPFYEKFGFKARDADMPGMMIRK